MLKSMQAFLLPKNRLKTWEKANISQMNSKFDIQDTSSISKILSHVGLVWSRNEGEVCGSFYEECKSKLTESCHECLSIHTPLFSECRQTIMQ